MIAALVMGFVLLTIAGAVEYAADQIADAFSRGMFPKSRSN